MSDYIPLNNCKHGYGYIIDSRNLSYGVFNTETNGFIGIRKKFGDKFLFTEDHWDTGAPHGTVRPVRIDQKCPFQDLQENTELFEWIQLRELETKNNQLD